MNQICVFCGSNKGDDPVYAHTAHKLGVLLANRGLGLVYGGAKVGLMGAVANAVLAHGGKVTGIIPQSMSARALAHKGLTSLRVVTSLHERKAAMAELADAFLALPGGYGTLEEFCEVLTWAQLGLHRKPCGLLNVAGFFDPFLAQIEHAVRTHFIKPDHRLLIQVGSEPEELLNRLRDFQPRVRDKWSERE